MSEEIDIRDLSHHAYGYETNADSSPGFEDSSEFAAESSFSRMEASSFVVRSESVRYTFFCKVHMFCQVHIFSLDSMIHARVREHTRTPSYRPYS